eukprot:EG_transcript_9116
MTVAEEAGLGLFSFEVFCHEAECLAAHTDATRLRVAVHLWTFPPLLLGPAERRAAADGARPVAIRAGKSCLFQLRAVELRRQWPLPLRVSLAYAAAGGDHVVLGTATAWIGDKANSSVGPADAWGLLGMEGIKVQEQRMRLQLSGHDQSPVGSVLIDYKLCGLGPLPVARVPPSEMVMMGPGPGPARGVGGRTPSLSSLESCCGSCRNPSPAAVRHPQWAPGDPRPAAATQQVGLPWEVTDSPQASPHVSPGQRRRRQVFLKVRACAGSGSAGAEQIPAVTSQRPSNSARTSGPPAAPPQPDPDLPRGDVSAWLRDELLSQLCPLVEVVGKLASELSPGLPLEGLPVPLREQFREAGRRVEDVVHHANKVLYLLRPLPRRAPKPPEADLSLDLGSGQPAVPEAVPPQSRSTQTIWEDSTSLPVQQHRASVPSEGQGCPVCASSRAKFFLGLKVGFYLAQQRPPPPSLKLDEGRRAWDSGGPSAPLHRPSSSSPPKAVSGSGPASLSGRKPSSVESRARSRGRRGSSVSSGRSRRSRRTSA